MIINIFVPSYPPPSFQGAERPSTWTAPTPDGLHRSSALSSPSVQPKEFLARACVWLPSYVCPPFAVLDMCNKVPVGLRVFPPGGPLFSMSASTICTTTPHPWRPRLAYQSPVDTGWWCHCLCTPIPCSSASPYLCSAPYLGIIWSLIHCWVYFCVKLEAWTPPLPGDCSPKPSPLRYSSMPDPFRLPGYPLIPPSPSPPCCHDPIPVGRISVGLSTRKILHMRI